MLVLVNAYISLRSCGSLNAEIQCCDIVSITSWLVTASFEWYRAHHKHAWWCRILHTTLWEFIRILIRALLRTATSSRSRSYPPTETRTPSLLALLHTGAAIGCQSHAKRGGKREREREGCVHGMLWCLVATERMLSIRRANASFSALISMVVYAFRLFLLLVNKLDKVGVAKSLKFPNVTISPWFI